MLVREYLQQKYSVATPTTMMASEARIFGIPYPLQTGWLAAHGDIEITAPMLTRLAESLRAKKAPMAKEGLRVLGLPATAPQIAAYSRKASKKQRKKEQRAAKVLELQVKLADTSRAPIYTPPKTASSRPPKPMFVGGVDVKTDAFLSTYEWRRVRMMALKKYGPVCQCCGATPATGAVMNVDHIKPRRLFPQLALDVDNLQILCHECNHGKGNWDMTDWREAPLDPESSARLDYLLSR